MQRAPNGAKLSDKQDQIMLLIATGRPRSKWWTATTLLEAWQGDDPTNCELPGPQAIGLMLRTLSQHQLLTRRPRRNASAEYQLTEQGRKYARLRAVEETLLANRKER